MRYLLASRRFVVGVVLVTVIALTPAPTFAGWDDQSGNLPGIGGMGIGTVVLIGVAAGTALAFMLGRRGPDVRAVPGRLEFQPGSTRGAVVLRNTGKKSVRIVSLDLARGDAFLMQPSGSERSLVLNPREELEVAVAFTPTRAGSFKDELVVMSRGVDGKGSKRLRVRVTAAATETDVAGVALGALP